MLLYFILFFFRSREIAGNDCVHTERAKTSSYSLNRKIRFTLLTAFFASREHILWPCLAPCNLDFLHYHLRADVAFVEVLTKNTLAEQPLLLLFLVQIFRRYRNRHHYDDARGVIFR